MNRWNNGLARIAALALAAGAALPSLAFIPAVTPRSPEEAVAGACAVHAAPLRVSAPPREDGSNPVDPAIPAERKTWRTDGLGNMTASEGCWSATDHTGAGRGVVLYTQPL
jgi:hypothetical protein